MLSPLLSLGDVLTHIAGTLLNPQICAGITRTHILLQYNFTVSIPSRGVCPVMGKMPAQLTSTSMHLCLSSKVLASVSMLLEDFISMGRISTSGAPAFLQASSTCHHSVFRHHNYCGKVCTCILLLQGAFWQGQRTQGTCKAYAYHNISRFASHSMHYGTS